MQIATLSKRNCNCITAERNVSVCSKFLVATANFRLVRLKDFKRPCKLPLFQKETAIVLPQKGTSLCAVNSLLQLQIPVWYGNKTSNVNASRLDIAEQIQSYPKCKLSLHPDNYPSCTAVRLHLHQIEMSDCANVIFDCFVQGNLLTSCKGELRVVFLRRKLLILFG